MGKRTEDWINFTNPEGKNRIGSPSYIQGVLGIDKIKQSIDNMVWRIHTLERKIHRLESPKRQKQVLNLLFEEEKPHTCTWLENRINNLDQQDVIELVKQGKLTTSKAGTTTMYSLSSITHEKRSTQ